ncbi:hypothetical protein [Myxacorys almedinensis]|uniref:Uncharacterized protein n=1 Tax=Myxacorys almedinensis A TaxID=2690445 RepID=A0A8J7YXV8_9CYAN|nr:hypothetical protein [Myxacorys almedinensis]NDJ16677.1 hypothetical protein [Myxacorys almedinensis A]
MYKRSLVVCAGVVALAMSGCGTGEDVSNSPSPSPVVALSQTATQSFSKPLVAEKKATQKNGSAALKLGTPNRVAGLLQSTDPLERARQVQAGINKKGQNDPFSGLPPVLSFNLPVSNNSSPQTNSDGLPSLPKFPVAPEVLPPMPTVATVGSTASPSSSLSSGKSGSTKPAIAALPPLPQPTLAEAVEVSGIIVVRGMPQAIVKAPNESTSRYVGAGQRLSNGQILVKRIEMNGGSDPIVVLEQNGIEVSRGVGEKATPVQAASAPTAMINPYSIAI